MIDDQSVVSRKQSASDLQSRLKTRKLLGVGELARDNGDIYKSKISQLLGINESLYVRLPKGLLYWNSLNTLYFYLIGFLTILVPSVGLRLDLGFEPQNEDSIFIGRLYGATLTSFGLLFRSILLQRETRSEIATLLLVTAILQGFQLLVCFYASRLCVIPSLVRIVAIIGNLIYHAFVDGQGGLYRQILRIIDDFYILINTPTCERKEKSRDKSKEE
uniref:Tumor protein p53-inducible protein 11 n=1 Tax=Heterorhabditis bacteriophora TaxID=37862 RepID=A0A1I7XE86_HETBA